MLNEVSSVLVKVTHMASNLELVFLKPSFILEI